MNGKLSVFFCIAASFFYAVEIVLTERKLGKTSPIAITFFVAVAVALSSLPPMLEGLRNGSVKMPNSTEILVILGIGFLSFLADWSHFVALNRGSSATLLATFYLLIPVLCTIVDMKVPTFKTIMAYVLSAIALLLLSSELIGKPPTQL